MAGAMTIRELITRYSFKTDTKPLKKIDNAVAGLKTRMAALDQKIIGAFTGLAKAAAVAAAGVSFAIVKMGSEAEQSEAKFDSVFGDEGERIRKWSRQVAKSMGRSEFQMREFASTLQDMYVPLGFARSTAADLSTNLVELAEDVASFGPAGTKTADVMRDFQSALVGNHETVRKYGIIITQARLDKKIAALKKEMPGFNKLAKEQQQVLARQKMIMEGTTDAHGDATVTAGSFENQLKRLRAIVEDTAKKIGLKLLPVITKWVKAAGDWVQNNEALIRQKVTEFLEKMLEALKALGKVLQWLIKNWKTVVTVMGVMVGGRILFGIASMAKSLFGVVSALGAVSKGAGAASGVLGNAVAGAGKLAGALGKVGGIGAALGLGWAFGKKLDEWFGLSDKIANRLWEAQRLAEEPGRRAKKLITEQVAKLDQLRDRAKQLAELRKKGVSGIQLEAGGPKVALNQENIARALQAQAEKLGITRENQGALIPRLLQEEAGLTSAQVKSTMQQVTVGAPQITVNVPPGTEATQAQRVAEAAGAATKRSMRQAMGDVAR